MSLADDIKSGIDGVLAPAWNVRDGQVVPETDDITLSNGAVKLEATYLYADMADSTGLAQKHGAQRVAKVIRCYLNAATRCIRYRGGEIRSFDGDRVMGIFIGASRNTDAARVALNINYAVAEVINPKLKAKYTGFTWTMSHGVGIDTGEALLVRGGVRGNNDLVSIGSAPNVAAKLSELRGAKPLLISAAVYGKLNKTSKVSGEGVDMWTRLGSMAFGEKSITYYGSTWWWNQ